MSHHVEVSTPPHSDEPSGFVAGTLVWTTKGQVPIEQIKVGDMVLSMPESGNGEQAYKRVVNTFAYDDEETWSLVYYDARKEEFAFVYGTPNLRAWVKNVGWTAIERVRVGQSMEFDDGSVAPIYYSAPVYLSEVHQTETNDVGFVLVSPSDERPGFLVNFCNGIRSVNQDEHHTLTSTSPGWGHFCRRVHNFEVEDFHTYFVGEQTGAVWVRNNEVR